MPPEPPDPDVLRAILNLLTQLGATPADIASALASADKPKCVIPTFSEYLPRVFAAATPGTHVAALPVWRRQLLP